MKILSPHNAIYIILLQALAIMLPISAYAATTIEDSIYASIIANELETGINNFSSVAVVGDVDNDGLEDVVLGDTQAYNAVGDKTGVAYLVLGKDLASTYDSSVSEFNISTLGYAFFGTSGGDLAGSVVSTAGDVNGDNYDDFLVSAPKNDDLGPSRSGTTYLIYGKATGWSGGDLDDIGVEFYGENSSDEAGESLSPAGDVNGDTYDDFLIGAPNYDDTGNEGRIYLILGSSSTLTDTDLADADAIYTGEEAGSSAGESISGGGNVNGDSYDDIIIGAKEFDGTGSNLGRTYVIYGQATPADTVLDSADVTVEGTKGERSGNSVALLGDVNDDTYDDIAIAEEASDTGAANTGSVYIIYGDSSLTDIDLDSADVTIDGVLAGDLLGTTVFSAGNVNNDDYDDILIGAEGINTGATDAGAFLVFYGSDSLTDMDGDDADIVLNGPSENANVGRAASAGLVDDTVGSDLFIVTDILVHSVSGAALVADSTVSLVDTEVDVELVAPPNDEEVGFSVDMIEDLDGDGVSEVVIGAPSGMYLEDANAPGAVFLLYSALFDFTQPIDLTDDNVVTYYGMNNNYEFGYHVETSGDINGDGMNDLLLSSPNENGDDETYISNGVLYVVYGSASLTSGEISSKADVVINGENDDDYSSSAVAVGNVNGDAYDDIIIGAPENSDGASQAGSTYVIYGGASLSDVNLTAADLTYDGAIGSEYSGTAVASGDVNGDGYDDVIIGAPEFDDSISISTGQVYVMLGGTSMSDTTVDSADITFSPSTDDYQLGYALAAADMNGDGKDDVLMGDERYDDSSLNMGAVYTVYGSSSLSDITIGSSNVEVIGTQKDHYIGSVVESIGDTNNDGYDDLLVGADKHDNSGTSDDDHGAAYLVYGASTASAITLSNSGYSWVTDNASNMLGTSMAGGHDLNGDGTNDVLVSAPYGNNTIGTAAGIVYSVLIDTKKPVVALSGTASPVVECSESYTDAGATQSDALDSGVSGSLVGSGTVSTNTPGDYTIRYTTDADEAGNVGTKNRTVTVQDTTKPLLTLIGDSASTLTVGDPYTELGATASDSCDTSLTVTTGGDVVDTTTAGTYTVTYNVTDSYGNTATKLTREVTVASGVNTIKTIKKKEGKIVITYVDDSKKKFKPFNGKKNFRIQLAPGKEYIIASNGKQVKSFNWKGKRKDTHKVHSVKLPKQYYRVGTKKLYGGKSYSSVSYINTHLKEGTVVGKLVVLRLTENGTLKKAVTKTLDVNNGNALKISFKKAKKRIIVKHGKGTDAVTTKWKLTKKGKLKQL